MKYYLALLKYYLKISPWKPMKPTFKFIFDGKEQPTEMKYRKLGKTITVSVTTKY